jgi:nitroreductase
MALFEAARWAPSCFGEEPWRYILWDRNRSEFSWQKAFDCLNPGNQVWAMNAPILLLALAGDTFRERGTANRWARYDTGAASENLCLQATAMGLMAHQMGGFDADEVRDSFSIPTGYEPMAMIAVGHPGQVDGLDGALRERELAERKRRPLSEIFFEDSWATALHR